MAKVIRMSEVSKHDSKRSGWLVIHDKIYDITNFMGEHPGGDDVLLKTCGKDATDLFEDQGHTSDARTIMKSLLVGELHEEDRMRTKKRKEKLEELDPEKDMRGGWIFWVIPLAFGLAATALYSFY